MHRPAPTEQGRRSTSGSRRARIDRSWSRPTAWGDAADDTRRDRGSLRIVAGMELLTTKPTASRSQNVVRLVLGAAMTFAGTAHLTSARDEFRAQVPSWVPVDEDLVVLASGVVEIGLGLALLALPKQRRLTGLALAAFFVAIFPGNVAQYVEGVDAFGLDTDTKRLVRLFGQPLLIAAALWAAGLPDRSAPPDRRGADSRGADDPSGIAG